jgi:hypothetical protein
MNNDSGKGESMDDVELAIRTALENIRAKAKPEKWKIDKFRSKAVKKAIVGIGEQFGWRTAANGCKTDERKEWLYDIAWFQLDYVKNITDVPLVVEVEWGTRKYIKYDFEKLLVSRSKYRVMVFKAASDSAVRDLFREMRQWITKFHRTTIGDRYLLVGWSRKSDHWIVKPFVA